MRTTTGSANGNPSNPNSPSYPPSVPMYVYRELATELKATQAKLDALIAKNQQIAQENQLLRQEISQVVQSFLHLQKLVDDRIPGSHPEMNIPSNYYPTEAPPRPQTVRSRQPVVPDPSTNRNRQVEFSLPVMEINPPISETVLIEEQDVGYYPSTKAKVKEFNGLWLAISILLIMLSAFGAGYLIVRPLFEHQSR
ncbi:hypothetical protein [Nostoc sp. TCL26-01]|uniref:hypothetical protein n=1 Tax=Nostoc sp. TCL26-01 TaxID=2576904 RepID=UPI0015BB6823|nr:hypothetical protein [Nostoc sp. TCL26-01]QLE57826.1 hypothetical protein FD725_21295 [Nostoc sp. TCL26-01]